MFVHFLRWSCLRIAGRVPPACSEMETRTQLPVDAFAKMRSATFTPIAASTKTVVVKEYDWERAILAFAILLISRRQYYTAKKFDQ